MEHILSALIPIFLLILIGYFFKKIKFPSIDFWASADKLTYYVLMPSLLVYKLATASLEHLDSFDFILAAILAIFIILLISILINTVTKTSGSSFTSVVQGAIRFNTYVFLALIAAMFGDAGIALAALLITFTIPVINLICISTFAVYAGNNKASLSGIIKSIISNPLIVACAIGGAINYSGVNLPVIMTGTLKILSSAALPMGLLSIGFALDLSSIKEAKQELVLSVLLKLLIMPLVALMLAQVFELDNLKSSIIIVFTAMPTAISSFILARQLGGDTKLMASIITVQTIASIFSISLLLAFLVHYFPGL